MELERQCEQYQRWAGKACSDVTVKKIVKVRSANAIEVEEYAILAVINETAGAKTTIDSAYN